MRSKFLLTLFVVVGLVLGLGAGGPTPTVVASHTSYLVSNDQSGRDFWSNAAESPDGSRLVAIWNMDLHVRTATSTDGGVTWSNEIDLATYVGLDLLHTQVIYDSNGNLHAFWRQGLSSGRIVYYRFVRAGRDPAVYANWEVGPNVCSNCINPDVAADRSGNIYVAYDDRAVGGNVVKVKRGTGFGFTAAQEIVISDQPINNAGQPAITVTPNNKVHLLFLDGNQRVRYARYTSFGNWTDEANRTEVTTTTSNRRPEIASDAGGRVYMAYVQGPADNRVPWFREYDGVTLSGQTQVGAVKSADNDDFVRVAVDGGGTVYVAWQAAEEESTRNVFQNKRVGGVWRPIDTASTLLTHGNGRAEYPMYANTWTGSVYITYAEEVPGNSIKISPQAGSNRISEGHNVMGTNAPATTWYFPEGNTNSGYDEYLTIQNPSLTTDASVTITYYQANGTKTDRPGIIVEKNSRKTVAVYNPTEGVGRNVAEVGARLVSTVPIIAERPMYFRYAASNGTTIPGGINVMGATATNTTWYFAEGTTRNGFDEFLTILNPDDNIPATVQITYYRTSTDGLTRDTQTPALLNVAPHSRARVAVYDSAQANRQYDVSAKVQSTNGVGVVAERPMYFTYGTSIKGGHTVIGVNADNANWYFAEGHTNPGFDEYLTIQNPNAGPATVTISYFTRDTQTGVTGTPVVAINVPANSRYTVAVHEAAQGVGRYKDVSARLTSTGANIIVERPMYFTYLGSILGGHNVMGTNAPNPSWFFAEGHTGVGFDEYLTIQNSSGAAATVTVFYRYTNLANGQKLTKTFVLNVANNTRDTVTVYDTTEGVGRGMDVSAQVTSTQPIIVERPMYFTYNLVG